MTEDIPIALEPAAQSAVAWINRERGTNFRLTGVVDTDRALDRHAGRPLEFGLVLCDGDLCLREQVRVETRGDAFGVTVIDAESPLIPPHLDPPIGVRARWLDEQLGNHAFIVLLFYRGFW